MNHDFHRESDSDKGDTYVTHHAKATPAGSSNAGGEHRLGAKTIAGVLALCLVAFAGIGASAAMAATAPTVTTNPAEEVGVTTVKLSGTVNPEGELGSAPTSWRIEYSPEGAATWSVANSGTIEGAEASSHPAPGEEANPIGVEAIFGFNGELTPGESYEFRIVAEREPGGGPETGETATPYPTFTMEAATPPSLTANAATAVEYTTATLHGEVDPEGGNENPIGPEVLPIRWQLQYTVAGEGNWQVGGEGTLTGSEATGSAVSVEAPAGGLQNGREYEERLLAFYARPSAPLEETSPGPNPEFETLAVTKPTVTIEAPSLVNANLEKFYFAGHVTPGNADPAFNSEWHFDCSPDCGSHSGPIVESGASPTLVEAEVEGLEPNTTYTVTLHASNQGGEETDSATFKTPAAPPLVLSPTSTPTTFGEAQIDIGAYVTPRNSKVTSCKFLYGPTAAYGSEAPCLTHPGDSVEEVLIAADSGQFRLGFESETTGDLAFDASRQEVREALEGLASIGAGNVSVSGRPGAYIVDLEGPFADTEAPSISAEGGTTSLELGGEPGSAEVAVLARGGLTTGGLARAELNGLTPGATYHMKLVASNAAGTGESEDNTFEVLAPEESGECPNEARRVEQHSTFLSDCRAYEMASPPDKAGGDVASSTSRTRAAADGSAVGFESLTGFAGARGSGLGFDYMSERSGEPGPNGTGWTTHAITPFQEPLTAIATAQGQDPLYEGEFTPDLTRGVFRAYSPIPGAASAPGEDPAKVANVENLYVRDDLRSPGSGSYLLASPCPACASPLPSAFPFPASTNKPFLAAASTDLSHVLIESRYKLAQGATSGRPNLYESVDGALRFLGMIPPGGEAECGPSPLPACVAAPRSKAGVGAGAVTGIFSYTLHTLSDDGSRAFFTVSKLANNNQANAAISGDLYMRDDRGTEDTADDTTVQLNAVEGGSGEGDTPATFWTASTGVDAAGNRVPVRAFFTTDQQLTPDDANGLPDLYMYDAAASAGHHLTRVSIDNEPADDTNSVDANAVLGTSDDGHFAYFVADGQLVAGKPIPASGRGLYAWHDGATTYIGAVDTSDPVFDVPNRWRLTPVRSRVTPDGKHLLFMSLGGADLLSLHGGTDYVQNDLPELYLYDAVDDSLACVSCRPDGAPPTADADDSDVSAGMSASAHAWHLNHPLSTDGRYVFFNTDEALLPQDTDGTTDAYSYDSLTGRLHLLSSGTDPGGSYFLDASESGRDVFLTTHQRLLGLDTDSGVDLYDARVGGGFPEPLPAAESCAGSEGCHEAPPPVPPAAGPASESLAGQPNPKPHRAKKHKHRRHHRGRHHHQKRKHKRANANRRASR
jgi:hypothetical protein